MYLILIWLVGWFPVSTLTGGALPALAFRLAAP
jgi:hypothetical protein